MYIIEEDNAIYLTRGDSAFIKLNILNSQGKPYTLEEGDIIRCQVRTAKNSGQLVFEGDIELDIDNDLVWHIKPENTRGYPIKTYYYDVQLETADGDIFTFIPPSVFKLLDEVTFT